MTEAGVNVVCAGAVSVGVFHLLIVVLLDCNVNDLTRRRHKRLRGKAFVELRVHVHHDAWRPCRSRSRSDDGVFVNRRVQHQAQTMALARFRLNSLLAALSSFARFAATLARGCILITEPASDLCVLRQIRILATNGILVEVMIALRILFASSADGDSRTRIESMASTVIFVHPHI